MANKNSKAKKSEGGQDRQRSKYTFDVVRFVLFLLVVALAAFSYWTYTSAQARMRDVAQERDIAQATADGLDASLKDFDVVNSHDHLYYRRHLDNYLEAAEATGIARTLFVASSARTLLGEKGGPDEFVDENSEIILDAAREFPGKLIPFCTIYPGDPDKLEKLKAFVEEGAAGLKLYTGHSMFHQPLDDPDMFPVYAYCEETALPICWHVGLNRYGEEFLRVMEKYPDLVVILPHFGQAYWRPKRDFAALEMVMDKYPKIYTDTSLGTRGILVGGLGRISEHRDIFADFIEKYQDRALFGTDMVVTGNPEKTPKWIESVLRACRDVLEKDVYVFWMAATGSGYAVEGESNPYGVMRGLALDDAILQKLYETNPAKLFPLEQ